MAPVEPFRLRTDTCLNFILSLAEPAILCDMMYVGAALPPTYLAAWMNGPIAYLYFPQTFAPSHRAQVLT